MAFLLRMLASLALSTAAMADTAQQRIALPPEVVFGRGQSETALKTEVLQRIFGKEAYNWDVDLEAGKITFTGETKIVTAPVQVIGTYNPADGTFLWGWDHPSVPAARAAHARLARQFGELNTLPLYTTRKIECTPEQAWGFTTTALYLAGAQGAYRGSSGSTLVFMTFGRMTISPKT